MMVRGSDDGWICYLLCGFWRREERDGLALKLLWHVSTLNYSMLATDWIGLYNVDQGKKG